MNESSILTTTDICSGYGTATVVRDISVNILSNEIVGVIGRNGVGKSTFVKTIIGLIRASSGSVTLFGKDITNLQPELVARKGVGYVPQGRGIFPRMTVNEHLLLGGYLQQDNQKRLKFSKLIFDLFPILHERKSQLAGSLSGGQQEMLAIGRALAGGPEILILDEPSEGVQPNIVGQIGEAILDFRKLLSLSVILIDQNASLISKTVDRAYAVEKGSVLAMLDSDAVRDEEKLSDVLSI